MANFYTEVPELKFQLNNPMMERICELKERGYQGFMTLEPHTFKYAVMKPVVYFVPFVKFAMKDYFKAFRLIDKKMHRCYFACASRKQVFLWQYQNLKKLLAEVK